MLPHSSTRSSPGVTTATGATLHATPAGGGRNVLIHVFDEYRKSTKDFVCRRDVLLAKMKYFQTYLNASNEHDEIDISVHCDVEVFEWLVQYMQQTESEWTARLALDNIASILVSSEFLQMDALVDACVRFVAARMQAFLQLRVDFNCLSDTTLGKIAAHCRAEDLQALHDPKDKLVSKLHRKQLEAYVERTRDIARCANCTALYRIVDGATLYCPRGRRQISVHGELVAHHEPTVDWRIDAFVRDTAGSDKRVSWSAVFWFVYASTTSFVCSACRRHVALVALHACAFHAGAVAGAGADAAFTCCGARAFDSDDLTASGCCMREHVPLMTESTDGDNSVSSAATDACLAAIATVPGIWELIRSCERAVASAAAASCNPTSIVQSAAQQRATLLQLLLIDPQDAPTAFAAPARTTTAATTTKRPATAATTTTASAAASRHADAVANPSQRRRLWRALALQEKDRVRHQLLARRLVQMRKNVAS